ncbi:MAG TPA: stalk domain-containing protein [Abditibacteriaceae bacterium]|jgi:hypothetical protein
MNRYLWLLGVAVFASPALANDSSFSGVGGTVVPTKGEHSSVRMVHERVVLDIYRDYYDTTVDFVFHNTGRKNIATMGFPEGNWGDGFSDEEWIKKSQFLRFSTSVDGKPLRAKRTHLKYSDDVSFDTFWIKVVPFAAGQKRNVQVRYRSRLGAVADMTLMRAVTYNFTGKNWKNKVDFSDLRVNLRAPGIWMVTPYFEGTPISMQRRGPSFTKTWRNWEAQGNFMIGIVPVESGWLVDSAVSGAMNPKAADKAHTIAVGSGQARALARKENIYGMWAPQAVVRDGVTYVTLSHLKNRLEQRADADREGSGTKEVELKWDSKTRAATLRAGGNIFGFMPGQKSWSVHSKASGKTKTLIGTHAPFVAYENFYVPLAPVARELKANVQVDSARHRFKLDIPLFVLPVA